MNNFKEIRRKDREFTDENRIQELLQSSEFGFPNLIYGYAIPIGYLHEKEKNSLYCEV